MTVFRSDMVEISLEKYKSLQNRYYNLAAMVSTILTSLLKKEGISFLNVDFRVKSHHSFDEKLRRAQNSYQDPFKEINDFAGIRVIVYFEDDVLRVGELIKKAFHYYPDKSLDKTDELGPDRFGYRSVHFVCDIGKTREKLPESEGYKGMNFEIQVRTVLQHAWAEIEHDRNYKFSGIIPHEFKRRFNSIAGLLEIADREFNTLANDIENYSETIEKKIRGGDLSLDLTTNSLKSYLKFRGERDHFPFLTQDYGEARGYFADDLFDKLKLFGVSTLAGLETFLTNDFLNRFKNYGCIFSEFRLIHLALMFADLEKYFSSCNMWASEKIILSESAHQLLSSKYGSEQVHEILKTCQSHKNK